MATVTGLPAAACGPAGELDLSGWEQSGPHLGSVLLCGERGQQVLPGARGPQPLLLLLQLLLPLQGPPLLSSTSPTSPFFLLSALLLPGLLSLPSPSPSPYSAPLKSLAEDTSHPGCSRTTTTKRGISANAGHLVSTGRSLGSASAIRPLVAAEGGLRMGLPRTGELAGRSFSFKKYEWVWREHTGVWDLSHPRD